MKVQLGEIRPMLDAIPVLLEKELPVKTAYWFSRAIKQLQTEFAPFEDTRKKLLDKYGVKDDQGNLVAEDGAYKLTDADAFNAEFSDVASEEVEIKFEPVGIEALGDITLKPLDILKLGRLIKDEE